MGAALLQERPRQVSAPKSACSSLIPLRAGRRGPTRSAVRTQPLVLAGFNSVDTRVPTVENVSGQFAQRPPSFPAAGLWSQDSVVWALKPRVGESPADSSPPSAGQSLCPLQDQSSSDLPWGGSLRCPETQGEGWPAAPGGMEVASDNTFPEALGAEAVSSDYFKKAGKPAHA